MHEKLIPIGCGDPKTSKTRDECDAYCHYFANWSFSGDFVKCTFVAGVSEKVKGM
jgi:hypothetical protein